MINEAFPRQTSQIPAAEAAPKQASVFERLAGTYRTVKERFVGLTKQAPKESESFRAAANMETKIQEEIGRSIRTVDDEVRTRSTLARQTFMDRLEHVDTKGMRRELAKLEGHLEMLARGAARLEAGIGTQKSTSDLAGMMKNLEYYYSNIEEIKERIEALRRKQPQSHSFSFFRKAESL